MYKMETDRKLNILIPSRRDTSYLFKLLDSIQAFVKVPFEVYLLRNTEEDPELIGKLKKNFDFKINIAFSKTKKLGKLYKKLWRKAPLNNYTIYLEDDDYLITPIEVDDLQGDLILCDYSPAEVTVKDALYWRKAKKAFLRDIDPEVFDRFEKRFNCFQLSSIIFLKKDISDFKWSNDLDNDFKLFRKLLDLSTEVHYKNEALFQQVIEPEAENISYPPFNKDSRWKSSIKD